MITQSLPEQNEAAGKITDSQEEVRNLPQAEAISLEIPQENIFVQEQLTDPILKGCFGKVAGKGLSPKQGLLYREKQINISKGELEIRSQLMVPDKYDSIILEKGHSVLVNAHLGIIETNQRITQKFHWPEIEKQVRNFCQKVDMCQKQSYNSDQTEVKMCPLPEISTPVKSIEADLIKTSVTSKLMKRLWQICGVKQLENSPYHPESDGLAERFNVTLMRMIKAYLAENHKNWDQNPQLLLYAYRSVPQESTGFSPFELLFGRHVRGPLDLIKQNWDQIVKEDPQNVITCADSVVINLKRNLDLADENLKPQKVKQKVWYDKNARELQFNPGNEAHQGEKATTELERSI